ncbi:hypothetical protein CK203_102464 [Vitis vinifera]|uniref:Uncharacterized protein n=1 Tax=Vitis vinifera TaxID=29760 RepID=A0A438CIP8_VITVI|nr:hypothetical protein CK203_102464 [Vitis vinifera]
MTLRLGELSDKPEVRDRCILEQRRRPRSERWRMGLDSQRDFEQRGSELDIRLKELPSHAPHALDHAHWMDVSVQISSLRTNMEEFALVHDTRFTLWRSTWISIRLESLLDLSTSSRDLSA